MSHNKLRKERVCLNCRAQLVGRYCHHCGQENKEPKESFWHLITHFINDITHFDGSFFTTIKLLIRKPGFLPIQYMNGRRASYLNPIRLYLFTSFIFFFVFFALKSEVDVVKLDTNLIAGKPVNQILQLPDSSFATLTASLNNGVPMGRRQFALYADSTIKGKSLFSGMDTMTVEKLDSLYEIGELKTSKVNYLTRRKFVEVNEKYRGERSGFMKNFSEGFAHRLPQLLFVSVPFLALLLQLLYIRRKKFYYVSHAIFMVYYFILVFLTQLVIILLTKAETQWSLDWLLYIKIALYLFIILYLLVAMKKFYGQGWGKTIFKYFLFLFASLMVTMILSFLFLAFTFWQL